MHRKSLEAAEHIRKQDESHVKSESLSTTSSSHTGTVDEDFDDKYADDFKNESVNILRTKAKEHSIKLIEDRNQYASKDHFEHVSNIESHVVDDHNNSINNN
jgi:hypothetical protein